MKRATIILATIILLSVVVYAFATTQSQPAAFKIRVHLTDGKVQAKCIERANGKRVNTPAAPARSAGSSWARKASLAFPASSFSRGLVNFVVS
jgi:hypothetical protein